MSIGFPNQNWLYVCPKTLWGSRSIPVVNHWAIPLVKEETRKKERREKICLTCSWWKDYNCLLRNPNNNLFFTLCLVTKPCLTLWDPMDCSPPGSCVHGISQARILEWVAIFYSWGFSQPRDWTSESCYGRQILYHWAMREEVWTPIFTGLYLNFAKSQSIFINISENPIGHLRFQ